MTMGDPSGIGPEVIVKAFAEARGRALRSFLLLGDAFVISKTLSATKTQLPLNPLRRSSRLMLRNNAVNLIDFENVPRKGFEFGREDSRYGKASLEYIDEALRLLADGTGASLVTGPVNKASIAGSGVPFVGHTEHMAERTGTKRYAMMLLGGTLRVVLVTRHIALKDVARLLSVDSICSAIGLTYEALTKYFRLKAPRIGVAGLNPHAGDSSLFGKEEEEIIRPAIERASRTVPHIVGPRPPDVIFYEAYRNRYDAVVAMYHDQGLIPLKMLYFDEGVNLTLGLPFVRTSPDHGSAFDIAGQGIAHPRSMQEAMKLAVTLSHARQITGSRMSMFLRT